MEPTYFVTEDFDQDGYADLAIRDQKNNQVTVLINKGDGRFDEGGRTDYSIGTISSIAAIDLDQDGDLDLVAPTGYTKSVLVMKNDGSGTFSKSDDFNIGDGGRKIIADDFNSDGLGDIAVINGYRSFAVLINDGSWKIDSEENQLYNGSKQYQISTPSQLIWQNFPALSYQLWLYQYQPPFIIDSNLHEKNQWQPNYPYYDFNSDLTPFYYYYKFFLRSYFFQDSAY